MGCFLHPALSPDPYRALVEASDGHAHGGLANKGPMPVTHAPHDHAGHAHTEPVSGAMPTMAVLVATGKSIH